MPRQQRVQFPGALYHITSRGSRKDVIFHGEADRYFFLSTLGEVISNHKWLCHAYCLMNNHYHLLIETPEGDLSKGMQYLNSHYAQAFNRRHQGAGHAFASRYNSKLVDKDGYLLAVSRYIVLNPVRAGLVDYPARWRWSNYRGTVGLVAPDVFLYTEFILGQFSADPRLSRQLYEEFVMQEITNNMNKKCLTPLRLRLLY